MSGLPPQGAGAKIFFVSILASPSSGPFPLAVSFSETIIDGTGPFTFAWTFGDGGVSTAANPSHTYVVNGVFTVTLVVTDSTGATATSITNVTAFIGIAIVATGLGMTEGIAETETVTLSGTAGNNPGPGLGPEDAGTRTEMLGISGTAGNNPGPGLGPEATGTLTETVTVTNP